MPAIQKDGDKQLSSPLATGGAGYSFESRVQASFVVLMLAGGCPPCFAGVSIKKIKLQGKVDGFETDDLIVFLEKNDRSKEPRKLICQVKRSVSVTKSNQDFSEFLRAAWKDFHNSSIFTQGKDAIALMTGPLSGTDARNVQWLLEHAKKTDGCEEFIRDVGQGSFSPSKAQEKLDVFRFRLKEANGGMEIPDEELYCFLRSIHLLSYDLDGADGVNLSLLLSHISQFDKDAPRWIWSRTVEFVQDLNRHAGTVTPDNIPEDLRKPFKQPVVQETSKKPDSTRASRDGHEFHEAWVARKAMQLLLPTGNLPGMAVEYLSPPDQKNASSETVQVADIALYYGEHPAFADSQRTEIVQFKYSVAGKDSEFRASDAKKTVEKFADTYRDFRKRHGAEEVRDKLRFHLITNRPVFPALTKAIRGLAEKTRLTGDAKRQAEQLKKAFLLDGEQLVEFASKFSVAGLAGNLGDIKKDLSNIMVDWSATRDVVASNRLGKMRDMVRDKAGSEGEGKNVITRMDVLAALEIEREEDLLPCSSKLPEVGRIVEREQLSEVVALVPGLARPLLVHAAGGMGKTVFMRSLEKKLKDGHEAVFFDCFAGGEYRSPEDSRHLPERGLIHIVNTLACRGLCDPVLPGSQDVPSLLRAFRRRLEQSVGTLARVSPERKLLLFLDAIDNAEVGARAKGEDCFPTLLLESFRHDPPDGVKIVASSRSHRIPGDSALGDSALYEKFELSAFSREETKKYLRTRLPDASGVEIRVAQARSRGNPRILEYLVESDRDLLDPSKVDEEIKLDQLIQSRIDAALSNAFDQGYERNDTDSFLAGLAVLPLPVPAEEYANSQGIEEEAVKSFASDMYPLLEITEQGLTFRDEPTETLIIEEYGSSKESLKRIAGNLLNHQEQSGYAARSLPELLYRIGDGGRLFELALDEKTFPEAVTGTVGRRNIRYARIKTALRYAADKQNYGQLVGLLVEMSTVAGADRLGAEYILDYPDLVVAAKDADAVRRLFETRPPWPGTRHARLAIANALSGDMDEAHRHAADTEKWIDHWRSQPREKRRIDLRRKSPKAMDIAAIPFMHAAEVHLRKAGEFMKGWKYRYAYQVWEHVFALLNQLSESGADFDFVAEELEGNIGGLTAALSFAEPDRASRKKLVRKLSEACGSVDELEFNTDKGRQRKRRYNFAEGLCKACGIALSLGSRRESSSMLRLMPKTRPGMRAFFEDCDLTPSFIRNVAPLDVVLFLFRVALTAATEKTEIREKNVMPEDLTSLCEDMEDDLGGEKFRKKLEKKINSLESVAYESRREAEQFINNRMNSLLSLVKALSRLLAAPEGKADEPFLDILNAWADAEKTVNSYGTEETSLFFRILGRKISTFSLWTRGDLGDASVKTYIERLRERERVEAATAIEVVGVLAKRPSMRQLAGEEAERARSLIKLGDDVRDRAHLYADLARAMLPASAEEATEYFVTGLREMEAVGSEDTYGFINELLLFAASLEGEELDERDFHKLTSICELNITEEPEKFPWTAFGEGLSRVSGCRGLAKLSRWNEMKAPLSCTLQPYLTALVRDGKIEPEDALALNRLACPEEFSYGCHTGTLARVIKERPRENTKELVSEVITQFMRNHHGFAVYEAANELVAIAGRVLGDRSETAAYLKRARPLLEKSRKTLVLDDMLDPPNERNGYSAAERGDKEIAEIVARSDDMDMKSFEKAIDDFMNIEHRRNLRETFFEEIRKKVPYEKRTDYVRMLAGHGTLNFHGKLDELERCRNDWESSSASLPKVYKEEIGARTLLQHAEDIVASGQLPLYELGRFPEIFGISIPALAVELVKSKNFTGRGRHVAREVWLGLAHIVCGEAQREGKEALVRLLNGPATRLSDNASDGEWKPGLYPKDSVEIFSGMLWRMLGSPFTEDRWRAAHSVRCFARFKRWKVLDALVEKINRRDAGAFQASERRFYFMHAKLWLLIALARIALDEPKAAAKYRDVFLKIAFDEENRHVLMKHFAAEAVGACLKAGKVRLSDGEEKSLRRINKSRFPQPAEKIMTKDDFYDRRPKSHPEPDFELFLDGHFYEYDVKSLGKVFGKAGWKVKDVMSEIVRSNHPEIESGRDFEEEAEEWASPAFGAMTHMSSHTYGQQLGWHALFMAAGRLLGEYAVTKDLDCHDDPWNGWLRPFLLTRKDGRWLSDGMDRAPLNALERLLEESEEGLVLTGDESKILRLLNMESGVQGEAVVAGEWDSSDQVRVQVESALVRPEKVQAFVKRLFREDALPWLPRYGGSEDEEEYPDTDEDGCEPWIVWPSGERNLDRDDPLGSAAAARRLRIARNFSSVLSLKEEDHFGRVWKNEKGEIFVRSSVWGCDVAKDPYGPAMGKSLACSGELLKNLLSSSDSDLIVLVKLQRREGLRGRPNTYTRKTAVVHVNRSLGVKSRVQEGLGKSSFLSASG